MSSGPCAISCRTHAPRSGDSSSISTNSDTLAWSSSQTRSSCTSTMPSAQARQVSAQHRSVARRWRSGTRTPLRPPSIGGSSSKPARQIKRRMSSGRAIATAWGQRAHSTGALGTLCARRARNSAAVGRGSATRRARGRESGRGLSGSAAGQERPEGPTLATSALRLLHVTRPVEPREDSWAPRRLTDRPWSRPHDGRPAGAQGLFEVRRASTRTRLTLLSLSDRIAKFNSAASSNAASPTPSALPTGGLRQLRSKFEDKDAAPLVPRGAFGLGAPSCVGLGSTVC